MQNKENFFKLSLEPLFKDTLVFARKDKLLCVSLSFLLHLPACESLFRYGVLKRAFYNSISGKIYVTNWWSSFFEVIQCH